jgi:two-component system alkaline phosphatase synthesis response regulator PhoP
MPHVLLCDDELHILKAAEFKLSRAGYEVQCACNGQEGWEAIQRRKPDILVTDLQMPKMNGFQLAQKVRATPETCDLPIIMLTGKGYEMSKEDVAAQFGIARVMNKPFSPRELLQTVQETLAEKCETAKPQAALMPGS